MARSPEEVQRRVGGLLPFIATPFAREGAVDLDRYRASLHDLFAGGARPTCCFVCCGTGELWSLGLDEYGYLVRVAVEEIGERVPIVAGVGYGTRLAAGLAADAQKAGAAALLVFPPYLVGGPQEGLLAHYGTLAATTSLGVFVYNRDNAVFAAETLARLVDAHPNVIGLKDGHGDLALLAEMRRLLGPEFLLMNGMPCAELHAWTYTQAGFRPYSPSAIEFLRVGLASGPRPRIGGQGNG